ncbi:MAG: WG repeat-containing protein [Oscillospiraceae bacterium]|jgi:hypothetical protein|nr:WG repeat-containing protein [Oscillospiraceae bacterium]
MKKKILSLALALSLILALVPFSPVTVAAAGYIEVVLPMYDNVDNFSDGMAAVAVGDRASGYKWGFVDKTGKEVVPCKYDEASAFHEGMAAVKLDGKWGYIDKTGKEVIPLIYENASAFSESLAPVRLDGKWGYVDKSGNEVIPLKYYSAQSFSEDLAMIGVDINYSGYIDTSGNEVIPPIYIYTQAFFEGLAAVATGNLLKSSWGFVDKTGKEVVPPKYDSIRSFSEGLAAVQFDGKWGFVDKTGKEVIPFKYDFAYSFIEGMASVVIDDKYGFIDKTGKEVIPPIYAQAQSFSEGLAAVCLPVDVTHDTWYGGVYTINHWGFIDQAGNEVVPCQYDFIGSFSEGLAVFEIYKWIELEGGGTIGLFAFNSDMLKGYIDKTGREVIPPIYTRAEAFSEGMAAVQRNGKWGFIALTDELTKPVEAPNLSTADTWAHGHIQSAYEKGFIPTDIQNNYKNVITRAEFCRMAVKWVAYALDKDIDAIITERGIADRMGHTFSDTTDPAILAAYRLGITAGSTAPADGKPGLFNPNGDFTRQEAAVMILNTCRAIGADVSNSPTADFGDMDKAAEWARPGINFVRANGIMSGSGGNFNPGGKYTRQESITTFNQIKHDELLGR